MIIIIFNYFILNLILLINPQFFILSYYFQNLIKIFLILLIRPLLNILFYLIIF